MVRVQVYLSKAQRTALDRRARESGQTRSHIVREAIATYLRKPTKDELEEAIQASAGAWKRSGKDDITGAEYVERIRGRRNW